MKVTMIVGEPCVGKSTLMRDVMAQARFDFRTPLYLPHHVSERLTVLGRYDDESHQFPGTDRMSMASQPHVTDWFSTFPAPAVVFEGARLGNGKMVLALQPHDFEVIHLVTDADVLAARREAEREQSDTFVRRAGTAALNVVKAARELGVPVRVMQHNNERDTSFVTCHIWLDRT